MARYFTFLMLMLPLISFGQKEADVWLFDKNLGIDFNDNEFRSFNTTVNLNQTGATASMCDGTTGRLLFFTNGRTVWNASFTVMPNGAGLKGGVNTHQAALIVPVPGADKRFYVFTTKSIEDPYAGGDAGLYYSLVDMDSNNGLGQVLAAQKNTLLLSSASDKLIAIPHTNQNDYWLITHEGNSDRFIVFHVTSAGIGPPVSFSFGIPYGYYESRGWLQASPDGRMLACAVSSDGFMRNPLEWYDFDASAGIISNRRELGLYPELTGVSFSPDNSKLYFTFSDQLNDAIGGLCQMDLNAGDTEAVKLSRTDLYALHDPFPGAGTSHYDTIRDGVIQLAPDGRLYMKAIVPYSINENGTTIKKLKIYFIDKPNLPGFLCLPSGREFNGIFSSPNGWAFPNLMPHYFNGLEPIDNSGGKNDCAESSIEVYPNPTSSLIKIDFAGNCNTVTDLDIYNSTGQLVDNVKIIEPFYTLDVSRMASGIYFFVFRSTEKRIVKKLVKQ